VDNILLSTTVGNPLQSYLSMFLHAGSCSDKIQTILRVHFFEGGETLFLRTPSKPKLRCGEQHLTIGCQKLSCPNRASVSTCRSREMHDQTSLAGGESLPHANPRCLELGTSSSQSTMAEAANQYLIYISRFELRELQRCFFGTQIARSAINQKISSPFSKRQTSREAGTQSHGSV
jgi:hypothetical protein